MPPADTLRGYAVFKTTEPAPQKLAIPRAASRWRKQELYSLGVEYEFRRFDTLPQEIMDGNNMPPEFIQTIEMYSKRIEGLDMKHLKACAGKYEIAETLDAHGLSVFHSTYRSLNTLLRRFRRSKTTTTTTTGGTTTTTTNPLSFKTPLQQQTVPETLSHTCGSDDTQKSSSSTESKPEPYAQNFVNSFMEDICTTVGRWTERVPWANPVAKLYIDTQLMFSAIQRMRFQLGERSPLQIIKSADDGGLSIYFCRDSSSSQLSRRPVLSVEAKRKKHKLENDEDTAIRHAAQIYSEILGQVCYLEFYRDMQNEYQEAFVIHIRHATISIFHAHLPNTYLSNIHVHGPRYSALFPTTPKIRLKQYGPWNMRHTQDQASLYRVLARVLWFLASGRSHVGYLAKCRGNPFVAKEARVIYDCVVIFSVEDDYDSSSADEMDEAMELDEDEDDSPGD